MHIMLLYTVFIYGLEYILQYKNMFVIGLKVGTTTYNTEKRNKRCNILCMLRENFIYLSLLAEETGPFIIVFIVIIIIIIIIIINEVRTSLGARYSVFPGQWMNLTRHAKS